MDKKTLINEIVKGIHEFKIIPFFGAGISKGLGFKMWGEIIDELKKELNTTSTDYLSIAQEYEDKFSRGKLIEKLRVNSTRNTTRA